MPLGEEIKPFERAPTRGLIAAQLREMIVIGKLAPGEPLRDVEIAAKFGVSRTPTREALLMLEREGLVESRPQGWTRVAPLVMEQFPEVHGVWTELQVYAARLTAERPDRDLAGIEQANLELAQMVGGIAYPPDLAQLLKLAEADDAFHDAVVRASGNQVLANTLRPINVMLRRHQFAIADQLMSGIGKHSVEQHEALVDAIRTGDAGRAAEIMRLNSEAALPDSFRSDS